MADAILGTTAAALTPSLTIENGQVTTTSLQIAEHFGKRHADVIRSIKKLECSQDFRERNFALTFQEVPGPNGSKRKEPIYRITRDGFVFLAMGFTGKEAAQWKEAYITAFNRMERELVDNAEKQPYSVSPSQTLSADQADTLRDMLTNFAKSLPKASQGDMMRQGWSKLKAHFKTDYRHIPASQFTEAVNIISRHMAAWSIVEAPALPAPTGIDRMLITKDLATGATTVESLSAEAVVFKSPSQITRAVMERRFGIEVTQDIVAGACMGMMNESGKHYTKSRPQPVTETLAMLRNLPAADLHELATQAHLELTFFSNRATDPTLSQVLANPAQCLR